MIEISAQKKTVLDWVLTNEGSIADLCNTIWGYSEPSLREYRSAKAHCEFLRKHGFTVEEGVAGLPTAFIAEHGSGRPVIGTYAEYDATPGQSQKPVPYRSPRVPYGPAFTDAHHVLGVAASSAGVAVAKAMREHDLKGTVKVFGTPAEKIAVGKTYMAKEGCFDGVDAFVGWHPGSLNTAISAEHGSHWAVLFTYECLEPWNWIGTGGYAAVSHPGALDAVALMYTITNSMKEHMLPRTGAWSINEFIMTGGQGTVDAWAPDVAQIYYTFRSDTLWKQNQIFRVLQNCAESAAMATYTKVTCRIISKTRPGLAYDTMTKLVYRNLELVGPPKFSEKEKEFAREIQKNIGIEPMQQPLNESLTPPEEAEEFYRQFIGLPATQRNIGSDDSSEFGWHAPLGRLSVAGMSLRDVRGVVDSYSAYIGDQKQRLYPLWTQAALNGTSIVHKMGFVAAKTLAASMVELLTTPSELQKAQEEYRQKVSKEKLEPLLPKDLKPPIDCRWPEWINNTYPSEPLTNLRWNVPYVPE